MYNDPDEDIIMADDFGPDTDPTENMDFNYVRGGEVSRRIDTDARYRTSTMFKNSVVTITTNLRINLYAFTWRLGGQLTSILSGNRLVVALKPLNSLQHGHRYSFLCFGTGKFILTNLFYFNHLQDIYNFVLSFCVMLINKGIAKVIGPDCTLLKFTFLVENCIFSFRFNEEVFRSRFMNRVKHHPKSVPELFTETNILHTNSSKLDIEELAKILCDSLVSHGQTVLSYSCVDLGEQDKPVSFPAICIKIEIKRDGGILKQYKSAASIKRNKNDFNILVISISFFSNGKVIGTGMAMQTDRFPWEIIARGIFSYFLKR